MALFCWVTSRNSRTGNLSSVDQIVKTHIPHLSTTGNFTSVNACPCGVEPLHCFVTLNSDLLTTCSRRLQGECVLLSDRVLAWDLGCTHIIIQDGAAPRKILKRIAKKYQDIVLWACFSPLRVINSKATNYLLSYFLAYPKRYTKAPPLDLLRMNTLRGAKSPWAPGGTKTTFFITQRYAKDPRPFYMEVPPGWDMAYIKPFQTIP